MNLLWVQLLYVQCCSTSLCTLIGLQGVQLILQGVQLRLLLAIILRLTPLTWELLGVDLVQKVAVLGRHITSVIVHADRVGAHAGAVLSSNVQVIILG